MQKTRRVGFKFAIMLFLFGCANLLQEEEKNISPTPNNKSIDGLVKVGMEEEAKQNDSFADGLRNRAILDYTIAISNESEYTLEKIIVANVLPSNVRYIASKPNGVLSSEENGSSVISWRMDYIVPNSKQKIDMMLKQVDGGTRINILKIKGSVVGFPNMKPLEIIELTKIPPELPGCPGCVMEVRTRSSQKQCKIGENIVYRIDVVNTTFHGNTNIEIENIVSKNMKFISATGPTSFEFKNGKAIFAPVSLLKSGDRISYEVTCKSSKPGIAKNISTVKFE